MSVIKPKNLGTLTLLLTPLNAIRESRIKPFRLSMPKTTLALATGKDMRCVITNVPRYFVLLAYYIRLSLHALHTHHTQIFFSNAKAKRLSSMLKRKGSIPVFKVVFYFLHID